MVIEAVQDQLELLLDRYDERDRAAAKELLEMRATMDARNFSGRVRGLLLRRPASGSFRFLASLLEFEDLIKIVLDSYRASKAEAISLAEKLQSTDPRFDTLFLKRYSDRDSVNWSEDELLAALEILDAVSERDRLVLGVSKFMRSPNANIRSRAAKFLARRRPTLGLIADLARESDPVVRAGLIEGLYDRKEEFVPPIFREHIHDQYPSVAASALMGMYQTGDPNAILRVDEMAKNLRPEFRVASATLMGRTGDPRFSSTLATLLSDNDEGVRRAALRGLSEIKRQLTAARSQSPLAIAVLKHRGEDARRSLWLTVFNASGEPARGISPMKFLLKKDGAYVRHYSVEEYDCTHPLSVALILCEPPKGERSFRQEFEEAAERFSATLRNRDDLAVTKLSHETHLRCYATDPSSSNSVLTKALGGIDFAEPHLNLIVVGTTSYTRAIERLVEIGAKSGATVHVVAIAAEWRTPEIRRQVTGGGGFFRDVEPAELGRACLEIYSALLHRYRVSWEGSGNDIELEVRSPDGTGTVNYRSAG
jgi:HEAT repeat protein